MSYVYDFIVVGSGAAGSALAYTLARSSSKPSILLLEAGGPNDDRNLRVDGQRWLTFLNKDMNWGYKTVPQPHAAGRELDYSRGRGLGGSTAINFGFWTVGARGDYDEWSRIVGDDFFGWQKTQARFRGLENFHAETPAGVDASKYVAPKPENHGSSGPLNVGFPAEWESDILPLVDAFEQAGFPPNPDYNSGNPLGMSVLTSSSYKGVRSTSQDLLASLPEGSVTIKTGSPVQRVILHGKKAVGVEVNGTHYFASKEVVLSAGSLDTPRILMHSGIGPADELNKFNIPVVQDTPAVGKGLRDHAFANMIYKRKPTSESGRSFFFNSKNQAVRDAALEQWKKDGTGPWAKYACMTTMGYFKLGKSFTESPEFLALPETERNYLLSETVPHYEVASHLPIHLLTPDWKDEDLDYVFIGVFLYNAQSRGTTALQSSDPNVPLLFDPAFLSTPFDRRAAVEALREILRFTESPGFAKDTVGVISAPKPDATDDELLAYWAQTISSSWHMTGTVKMGGEGDADAVVDSHFRVKGIENLRVADMSVVPVLVSAHTQVVAYLTGIAAGERLVQEYNL
ncbi:hypothetical protein QBC47DRAFT_453678 [Echria macrotheca]|uniref:Glucose-methanol-choline oxidoreductase N-terminal domain-containing protein n=1 Tax=Echria macrotheca TaxID=438768 RepID=A0AAJ0F750_9PEZI|nr:hypothetical protein QBC47DRAFT_453678 [Echria macrotheca]